VRVRDVRVHHDAARTLVLDLSARPLPLPADAGWCATVWRPVPHLHHPWQPRRAHRAASRATSLRARRPNGACAPRTPPPTGIPVHRARRYAVPRSPPNGAS
jgi:hypothetical protein